MQKIHQTPAEAAKAIKKELRRKFPGVKFSVRSRTFSGGDSIDIDWVCGPTEAEVAPHTAKYQEGSFDGMRDQYDTDPTWVTDEQGQTYELGGAKYVHCHRQQGRTIEEEQANRERIARTLARRLRIDWHGPDATFIEGEPALMVATRILHNHPMPKPRAVGVEAHDGPTGAIQDRFRPVCID